MDEAQAQLEETVVHRTQLGGQHAPFGGALAGGEGGHAADHAVSRAVGMRMVI